MPHYFAEKITCPVCNKRCGYQRTYKDFCSKKCKNIFNGITIFGENRNCVVCETEFNTTYGSKIYCSKECAAIFHKNQQVKLKSEFSIFHRDKFKCIYCGKSPIEDDIKLEVEHIDPFSKDGLTHIDNLVTACDSCNGSKSAIILSRTIVKRILSVINERNKNLSDFELSLIIKEIEQLKKKDIYRLKVVKN